MRSSHLSTIINRVKTCLYKVKNDAIEASKDPIFREAVRNLAEYQDTWNDFTNEEKVEADELYFRYFHLCGKVGT